jgi:hypothetical protein
MDVEEILREAMDKANVMEHGNEPMTMAQLQVFSALVLESAAKALDARYMGDLNREDMEARRCAEAIRALKPLYNNRKDVV